MTGREKITRHRQMDMLELEQRSLSRAPSKGEPAVLRVIRHSCDGRLTAEVCPGALYVRVPARFDSERVYGSAAKFHLCDAVTRGR